jgi:ABC-2 type transport system ATP-binding protein
MSEILRAVNVSKSYASHQALKNVSIDIPRQTVFGLLGPNGAGKSTLIRIITQIISKDSGEVFFKGQPLTADHVYQMGYMPEERGLYKKMKVGEQLLFLAQLKGLRHKEAMAKLKFWIEKFDIKSWWNKKVEDLSKGMQQKIQFIATVLHDPELLILDEPFSGFDPVNANLIKDEILRLKEKGTTIIFSTHRMESVEEMCDHIALINKSEKILDGNTQDIKKQYRADTYAIEFKGQLTDLQPTFSILSQASKGMGYQQALLKAPAGATPNQIIAQLINQVELHKFEEKLPTINDIFISLVTGKPIFQEVNQTILTELNYQNHE